MQFVNSCLPQAGVIFVFYTGIMSPTVMSVKIHIFEWFPRVAVERSPCAERSGTATRYGKAQVLYIDKDMHLLTLPSSLSQTVDNFHGCLPIYLSIRMLCIDRQAGKIGLKKFLTLWPTSCKIKKTITLNRRWPWQRNSTRYRKRGTHLNH